MRLLWRMYFSFFACTLLALALTSWYSNYSFRSFYQDQISADLLNKANILASELASPFAANEWEQVARRCKEFGRLTQTRVTVILPDGRVIGESDQEPSQMENHKNRPEIADALMGKTGKAVRFSDTIRRTSLYLAIPVYQDGAVVGVVRTSLPLAVIEWSLQSVFWHAAVGALIVAAFFAIVSFHLARRMTQPLDEMRRTAERLARGDLKARVPLLRGPEMASFAHTLNQMASQLSERMDTITLQSDQQKAVFASMAEGVLAVDSGGRVLDLNLSAAQLLDVRPEQVRGLSIQEAVRNVDLQKFVTATLTAGEPTETEIMQYGNTERFLQLHGTALRVPKGKNPGALIVLNDITRVKRLETVRQDFVANVSHELKTPITALRGCVETLSDPVHRNSDGADRFIAMMRRQVERLTAIVEDLLSLSRIEHDAEHKRIPLESGVVCEVLRRAAQAFAEAGDAKGISVEVECPGDLIAPLNAALLEQAVGNLVDNAIKYSGEHTRVVVGARLNGPNIEIMVADQGFGIEKKHLSRIFERFYRVDQARSRALGGTGLGLAIVKHIVLAHGGVVSVDSTPGKGSTFTIRIPRQ